MHRFKTIQWDHTAAGTTPDWWKYGAYHWQKLAADPNGSDTQFEQAFSNLAHSYLRDKAPKLLDYEVGFQLIDKNEERTKAIGVIGFKLGEQWLYAPVFFLNGDLKGHDLLYIKNQDAFVPLKENWLNYLLGRKPVVLGDAVSRNTSSLGVLPPSLREMSRSPFKFAGHRDRMPAWAVDAMACFARWATTKAAADRSLAEFIGETGFDTVKYLARTVAANYPDVLDAVERFHPGLMAKAAKTPTPNFDPVEKRASIRTDVVTVRRPGSRSILGTVGLTVEEREKMAAGEPVIEDRRVTSTAAYRVDTPKNVTNPSETGIYDVLVSGGDFVKCLVARPAVGPAGRYERQNDRTLVIPIEGEAKGRCVIADQSAVWVVKAHDRRAFIDWFDELADGEVTGGDRVAIGQNGETSFPFRVYEGDGGVIDTAAGSKGYRVTFDTWKDSDSGNGLRPKPGYSHDPRSYEAGKPPRDSVIDVRASQVRTLFRQAGEGDQIVVNLDSMLIPNTFKFLPVKGRYGMEPGGDLPGLALGSIGDLWTGLLDGNRKIKVRVQDDGTVESGFGRSMAKGAAVLALVQRDGVSEKTAAAMIDQAVKAPGRTAEFLLVKAAYGEPVGDMTASAPGSPAFPEPPSEWEPTLTGGVPAIADATQTQVVPGMEGSRTDRSVYDPRTPDRSAIQSAQQAADSGQKEVFDTAMLGTMLKVVRSDGMVDRYLGDLMKGLDRLGRILFLYYWHGDKFAERYGKQDMPELEDSIRNAFENTGDVVLALKRKSIEPSVSGVDVDLSDSAN